MAKKLQLATSGGRGRGSKFTMAQKVRVLELSDVKGMSNYDAVTQMAKENDIELAPANLEYPGSVKDRFKKSINKALKAGDEEATKLVIAAGIITEEVDEADEADEAEEAPAEEIAAE